MGNGPAQSISTAIKSKASLSLPVEDRADLDTMTEPEAARLTTEIQLRLDTIADNIEQVIPMIEQARTGGAHQALGYPSWTAYVADKFGGTLARLGKSERLPVVELLAGQGMSTRSIASVVGVSNATVSRDLAGVTDVTPEVVGVDGKTYIRPAPPQVGIPATLEAAVTRLNELDAEITAYTRPAPQRPFHPIADRLIPMRSADDDLIDQMAASISELGLLNPITVLPDGSIIDGRLRYLACRRAEVAPSFQELPPPHDDERLTDYFVSMNLHRGHYTEGQRVAIAVGLEERLATAEVLDARIDKAEAAGIRDCWEFGQELLDRRDDNGRLPSGCLTEIVKATGTSRTELVYRMRLAERYPTLDKLSVGIAKFRSWDAFVRGDLKRERSQ